MKPGNPRTPVTFTFLLSAFATILISSSSGNPIELLDLLGESELNREVDNFLAELKPETCAELSFRSPLNCIRNGCRFNPMTGECKEDSGYIPHRRRAKRDSERKCFHFRESPKHCEENGCRYDSEKRKCLNLDGSDDPPATPSSLAPGTYKWMEKPSAATCKQYHGKPRACGFAGCTFNKWNHRCLVGGSKSGPDEGDGGKGEDKTGGEQKDCSAFNGAKTKCKKAKCSFDSVTSTCSQKADDGHSAAEGRGIVRVTEGPSTNGPVPAVETTTPDPTCARFNGDRQNCMDSKIGCVFNETSEGCIEAKEPPPASTNEENSTDKPLEAGNNAADTGDDDSVPKVNKKKYCDFLYGKKENCEKVGCSHDKKNKKCDSGVKLEETDKVTITYVETKREGSKLSPEECSELDGSPRGCLFAGCVFDENKNKCVVGKGGIISIGKDMSAAEIAAKYLTPEECSALAGKQRACKSAGCQFLENNGSCVPGKRIPKEGQCMDLDNKPVDCIQQGCLYDNKHKKCFVGDFHEQSYTISYVKIKLKRRRLVVEECSELDGSQAGCAYAGCKYEGGSSKCLEGDDKTDAGKKKNPLSPKECSAYNGKLRGCGYAGCRYMTKDKKCIVNSPAASGCGILEGDKDSCTVAGCLYEKDGDKCNEKPAPVAETTTAPSLGRGLQRETTAAPVDCSPFNGKRKSCAQTGGCQYDKTTKICSPVVPGESGEEDGTPSADSNANDCGQYNGKRKTCIKAKCEYDNSTKTCSVPGEDGSDDGDGGKKAVVTTTTAASVDCAKFNGKRKSCIKSGCEYDKLTAICSGVGDDVSDEDEGVVPATTAPPEQGSTTELPGTTLSAVDCTLFNGNGKACTNAGCDYDKATKACSAAPPEGSGEEEEEIVLPSGSDPDCTRYNGKRKSCLKAGCEYNKQNKTCSAAVDDDDEEKKPGDVNEVTTLPPSTSKNCEKHNGNLKSCVTSGCKWEKSTKVCSDGGKGGKSKPKPGLGECGKFNGKQKNCLSAGCNYHPSKNTCHHHAEIKEEHREEYIITHTIIHRRKQKPTTAECSELDGNRRACHFAGCQFQNESNKCEERPGNFTVEGEPLTSEECVVFNERSSACLLAGCHFHNDTKKCDAADPIVTEYSEEVETEEEVIYETENCGLHDHNPQACAGAGCSYDGQTEHCSSIASEDTSGKKSVSTCNEFSGSPNACEFSGCKYNYNTSRCVDQVKESAANKTAHKHHSKNHTDEAAALECKKYQNKPKLCGKAGCLYDKTTGGCTVMQEQAYDYAEEEGYTALPGAEEPSTTAGTGPTKRMKGTKPVTGAGDGSGSTDEKANINPNDQSKAKVAEISCRIYDGKKRSCNMANKCLFVGKTKKCFEKEKVEGRLSSEDCGEMDKSEPGCEFAGCDYDDSFKKCLLQTGKPDGTDDKKVPLDNKQCLVLNDTPKGCEQAGCRMMGRVSQTCKAKGFGRPDKDEEEGKPAVGVPPKSSNSKPSGGSPRNTSTIRPTTGRPIGEPNNTDDDDKCSKHNGDSKTCESVEQCDYDTKTNNCSATGNKDGNCTKHDGNPTACAEAGCSYLPEEKLCISFEGGKSGQKANLSGGQTPEQDPQPANKSSSKRSRPVGRTFGGQADQDECENLSEDPQKCESDTGCDFDPQTKKCFTKGKFDNCSKHDGDPAACEASACTYLHAEKDCISPEVGKNGNGKIDEGPPISNQGKPASANGQNGNGKIDDGPPISNQGKPASANGQNGNGKIDKGSPISNQGKPASANGQNGKIDKGSPISNQGKPASANGQNKTAPTKAPAPAKQPTGRSTGEKGNHGHGDHCRRHSQDAKSCGSAGCEFDMKTKTCHAKGNKNEQNCYKHNKDVNLCVNSGCTYLPSEKLCTPQKPAPAPNPPSPKPAAGKSLGGKNKKGENNCKTHRKNKASCVSARCEFDSKTENCYPKHTDKTCRKHDGDPKICGKSAGCTYLPKEKHCILQESGPKKNDEKEEPPKASTKRPVGRTIGGQPKKDMCKQHNNNQKKCESAGCEFESKTKTCFAKGYKNDSCTKHDGSPTACDKAGCIYLHGEKRCTSPEGGNKDAGPKKNNSDADPNFLVGSPGSSSKKFAGESLDGPQSSNGTNCSKHNNDPQKCEAAGCDFDKETKICSIIEEYEDDNCTKHDGDPNACVNAGCVYLPGEKHCNSPEGGKDIGKKNDSDVDPSFLLDGPGTASKRFAGESLDGPSSNGANCSEHNNDPEKCGAVGCAFDTETKNCYLKGKDDNCTKHNGDANICVESGCIYIPMEKQCISNGGGGKEWNKERTDDKAQDFPQTTTKAMKPPSKRPVGRTFGGEPDIVLEDELCSKHSKDPEACKTAGCEFNGQTNNCYPKGLKNETNNCTRHDGAPDPCLASGCVYTPGEKRCSSPAVGPEGLKIIYDSLSILQAELSTPVEKPIGGQNGNADKCRIYGGKPKKCGAAGCEFHTWTKICYTKGYKDDQCTKYDGDSNSCGLAGCLHLKGDNKCIPSLDENLNGTNGPKNDEGLISLQSQPAEETTSPPSSKKRPAGRTIGGGNGDGKPCKKYKGPKQCGAAGCDFDSKTKKCYTKGYKGDNCTKYDGDANSCDLAGCRYLNGENKCMPSVDGSTNGTKNDEGIISLQSQPAEETTTTTSASKKRPAGRTIGGESGDGNECRKFKGLKKCEAAGCEFDTKTKKCYPKGYKNENCTKYDGDSDACGQAGCVYFPGENKCSSLEGSGDEGKGTDGKLEANGNNGTNWTDGASIGKNNETKINEVPILLQSQPEPDENTTLSKPKRPAGRTIGGDNGNGKKCRKYKGPKQCGAAGCDFDSKTRKCYVKGYKNTNCTLHNGDPDACDEGGCIYLTEEKQCTFREPPPTNSSSSAKKRVGGRTMGRTIGGGPSADRENKCNEHNQDPRKCGYEGCDYNKKTKICFTKADKCTKHNGEPSACEDAGCIYLHAESQCTPPEVVTEKPTTAPPKKRAGGRGFGRTIGGGGPSSSNNNDECKKHSKDPRKCGAVGCEFNTKARVCHMKGYKIDNCTKHDGDPNACDDAGCIYLHAEKQCTSPEPSTSTGDGAASPKPAAGRTIGRTMGGQKKNRDNCNKHSGDAEKCGASAGCQYEVKTTTCNSKKSKTDNNCAKHNEDPSACDEVSGCVYIHAEKLCNSSEGGKAASSSSKPPSGRTMGEQSATENNCKMHNKDPRKCGHEGCHFDSKKKKCFSKGYKDKDYYKDKCPKHDGDQDACDKEGCFYLLATNQCSSTDGGKSDKA